MLTKGFFFKVTAYFFVLFTLSDSSLANKIIYVDDDEPADFYYFKTIINIWQICAFSYFCKVLI